MDPTHFSPIDTWLLDHFREYHAPMARFLETLVEHPWAAPLRYCQSHCLLWIARPNVDYPEVIVAYGDGSYGGRPRVLGLDRYDVYFRATRDEIAPQVAFTFDGALEAIRAWVEAAPAR